MSDLFKNTPEQLQDAVDRERRIASVRSLDLSLNELADMHKAEEIHIAPEYQRTFRWDTVKQSRFIESLILEMPVPPIYVVEVREGEWELIDGLQRISTYLHFRSQLDLPSKDPPIVSGKDKLVLTGCSILKELEGYAFDELPTKLQYRVRRSALRVELVRRETNPRFAYHMFTRLNAGGEPLSEQETRNCSIRLLDNTFNDYIIELAKDANFGDCISDVTDEARERMFAPELVLRFFAFKNAMDTFVHDIHPFLTWYMEKVSTKEIPFDYEAERTVFRRTFSMLASTLRELTARRWVEARKSYGGGFSTGHFEAFSVGLANALGRLPVTLDADQQTKLKAALEAAKKEPELKQVITGGGKNYQHLYKRKVQIVAQSVGAAFP